MYATFILYTAQGGNSTTVWDINTQLPNTQREATELTYTKTFLSERVKVKKDTHNLS